MLVVTRDQRSPVLTKEQLATLFTGWAARAKAEGWDQGLEDPGYGEACARFFIDGAWALVDGESEE